MAATFSKDERIRRKQDFQRVYQGGKKIVSSSFILYYCLEPERPYRRLGIAASRKVGNAVKRNLAKRRLRAVFLEIQSSLREGVYVFVAKEKMNHMSYETLKQGIVWSMKKLNCVRE